MDANDIIDALNGVLELGDKLDDSGIGILQASDYEHSTRDIIKLELGSFLIYIGDGGFTFTDAQATLVNLCLADRFGEIPSWQMKSVAAEINEPDPYQILSYAAFENADKNLTEQNGISTHKMTDILIDLFESFGRLMVTINESTLAQIRYDQYMNGLKARLANSGLLSSASSGSSYTSITSSGSSIGSSSSKATDAEVRSHIPAGVSVTDNQMEYLKAIVYLINRDGSTDSSSVAIWTHKTQGQVSSAVKALVKKGILEINNDAKIVFAEHSGKEEASKPIKKASAKNPAAGKNGGKVFRYDDDDDVSFELPAGLDFLDETDDKGKRSVQIGVNPKRENGETNYDKKIAVTIVDMDDGENALDHLEEANKEAKIHRRYNTDPEALLIISETSSSIFGVSMIIRIMALNIAITKTKALSLRMVGGGAGDSMNDVDQELEQLMSVWPTVMIQGRKVETEGLGKEEIVAESNRYREEEAKRDDTKLDCTVRIDGRKVRIGNRWEMTLPLGWRVKEKEQDSVDGAWLTFYEGSIPLTNLVLGETIRKQKEYNTAMDAAMIQMTLNAVKLVEDESVRRDDRLEVSVSLLAGVDGSVAAGIKIIEKELHDNEVRMHLILTGDMAGNEEAVRDALQKVKDKNYLLGHPFGLSYEHRWMGTLNLAASIRPVEEEDEKIPMQRQATFYKDITGCVPKGLKLLKGEEEDDADVYYPAKGTPSQKNFLEKDHEYYLKLQTKDGSGLDDIDGLSPIVQAGIYSRVIARTVYGPAAEKIRECYMENGYKALWLNPVSQFVSVGVTANSSDSVYLEIHTDTEKQLTDLIQIGEAIYDTIEINGKGKPVSVPPFPPDTQLFHEHYDLVTSGQYTTHRSADFRGQSIRGLMEDCGTEGEDAYDMMKIEGDTYNLDKEAISLAKVFRLNESLFDPYRDTEALIREGMFMDARMFQVLRSLAWSVSMMADRESRDPGDYFFEELEKLTEPITENNNINYQAYSYCPGLCDHYDWHVFYVPDAYLSRNEKDDIDLRYLTGKENRGGNSISIFAPGLNGLGNMTRVSDLISRNEETLESLDGLRKDLEDMLPVMRTIHDGLLKDRDRNQKLEGPLADALTAWCALAIAAREPFYSEEAADTPEANAGLNEPLVRPDDKLDDKPANKTKSATKTKKTATSSTTKKTVSKAPKAAPKSTTIQFKTEKESNSVRILELNGATTIENNQYFFDQDKRPLEIPEGVISIGSNAFMGAQMSSVKLPRSLKIINGWAFEACKHLALVEIQEGLEEIGSNAFAECPKLTIIKLPSTIRKVDSNAFVKELGPDMASQITIYIPGVAARNVVKNKEYSCFDAVIAAGFMVDGRWFPALENYVDQFEAEEKKRIERERAEQREREERERQERQRREDEQRRERQRGDLENRIRQLKQERDSVKGLFAGMKRNKIQKEIDALTEQLRRI